MSPEVKLASCPRRPSSGIGKKRDQKGKAEQHVQDKPEQRKPNDADPETNAGRFREGIGNMRQEQAESNGNILHKHLRAQINNKTGE
jgi:hypothetical protein